MKQHITSKQLNQLTDKQKENLRSWWQPKEGDYVLIPKKTQRKYKYGLSDFYDTQEDECVFIGAVNIRDGFIELPEFENDNYFLYSPSDCLPLLSIGQMIEFLYKGHFNIVLFKGDSLCDALWEAVKERLENYEK